MLNSSQQNNFYLTRRPVPVICSFNGEGKILPLYVRINEEDYKIYSSCEQHSTFNESVFKCEIIDYDIQKQITLVYHHREHIWLLKIS